MILFIQDAIIRAYGNEVWSQIEEYIELDRNEIEVKKIYPDGLFPKIIEALIEIRHSGTHDTYMEFFGKLYISP